MYLTGYRRSSGMGLAVTMPSSELMRIGTGIRTFAPAPISTVNRPIVSTPTPLPQPSPAPVSQNPVQIIRPVGPIYAPRPPILPARPPAAPTPAPPINVNAGTPVPAGYPTSQIFVNTDGSFWEYSSALAKWINTGTPYNTGASATPPAPPPTSSGASSAAPAGTTAPPPVNVSVASASSGYQEIFDWLQQDTLLSSIGFAGIPNWIAAGAGALLLYKVSSGGGKR
jgi:hypothetical protein